MKDNTTTNFLKRGRPPKKHYDPAAVLQELLDTVDEVYQEKKEIKAAALELNLAPLKVKKLLITSGQLKYPETEQILNLKQEGKTSEEIQEVMGLSRASINSYLPYSKIPYKGEMSQNAERVRLYKERKEAIKVLLENETEEQMWECVKLFQTYPFHTSSGLPFTYILKLGRNGLYTKELFVDRMANSKSLSWSSVLLAFERAREKKGEVIGGPKALGDIRGISYVYSILWRFGIIEVPVKLGDKMRGNLPIRELRDKV